MEPRIIQLESKKLVGIRMHMSLADNKTADLWRRFMPLRGAITNRVGTDLISMQLYSANYFIEFNPHSQFEKWAAVEVADHESTPPGMEDFTLTGGWYAVFLYKGAASEGDKVFQYIFGTWLPSSPYHLDDRPHFEVLGAKYNNVGPDSEEEIWIPIRKKSDGGL
jgi:AraC family transcriptional regulator